MPIQGWKRYGEIWKGKHNFNNTVTLAGPTTVSNVITISGAVTISGAQTISALTTHSGKLKMTSLMRPNSTTVLAQAQDSALGPGTLKIFKTSATSILAINTTGNKWAFLLTTSINPGVDGTSV